jgi:hypothetical protein
MRNVSKNNLIEAMEAGVFFRVVHSVSDIDNLRSAVPHPDQKRVLRTCSVNYKLVFTKIQKYQK